MNRRNNCPESGGTQTGVLRRVPSFLAFLVALLIVLPYTLSYSDTSSTFTLVNRTRYYIHAHTNQSSYAFIAPGGVVVEEVSTSALINASVTYSPGQGVHGKATQSFEIRQEYSNTHSTDCSSTSRGNDCSSNIDASTTIYPARWDVTEADLAVGGNEE